MAISIETHESGDTVKVVVNGEVDLYTSPDLRAAIAKAVPKTMGTIEVDLSNVAYMDSSGVATLVEGLRAADKKDVRFALVSPSPSVMKVLQLSRLDAVFTIKPSA